MDSITDQFSNTVRFSYIPRTSQFCEFYSEEEFSSAIPPLKNNWLHNNATNYHTDSIVTSNEIVVFYNSFNRLDIGNEAVVDSIKVLNKKNELIRRIKFYHSYFSGIPGSNYVADDPEEHHKRLRLDSIDVSGMVYRFTYNPAPLPSRHSKDQDAWGYFNNAGNTTLLANYFGYSEGFGNYILRERGNRCPNPEVVQVGMLTDIKYPTGGTTHFEYEPNTIYAKQFDNAPELVPYRDSAVRSPEEGSYDVRLNHDFEVPFTVHYGDLRVSVLISLLPPDTTGWSSRFSIELYRSNGEFILTQIVPNSSYGMLLQPGDYMLKIKGKTNYSAYLYVNLTWKTPLFNINDNNDPYVNKVVGGLRIKSITDYDISGSIIQKTNYRYASVTNENHSSGTILKYPVFHKPYQRFIKILPSCITIHVPSLCESEELLLQYHRSVVPIDFSTEYQVGYSRVVKEYGIDGVGGKSVYTFTDSKTNPDFILREENDLETSPYTSVFWQRGLILDEQQYEKTSTGYSLKQSVENFYTKYTTLYDTFNCVGMAFRYYFLPCWNDPSAIFCCEANWYNCGCNNRISNFWLFLWRPYLTITGLNQLDSTKTINYYSNGTVTETAHYSYNEFDPPKSYQLLKQKDFKASNGDIIRETYSYPSDFSNLQAGSDFGINNMKSKHIIENNIEISRYIKKSNSSGFSLVSSSLAEYYPNMAVTKRILKTENAQLVSGFTPAHVSGGSLIYDLHYRDKFMFDQYDQKGNLLQVHPTNGAYTSYVYGNNDTYPIAKIENATKKESGFTGFEDAELNGWQKYTENTFINNPALAHTGSYCIKLNRDAGPFCFFAAGDQAANHSSYKASVWVNGSQSAYIHIEVNGVWTTHVRKTNTESGTGWHLLEVEIPKEKYESYMGSTLQFKVYVGGDANALFDDLRFCPSDAAMTTYTYKPLVGMTSESDAQNIPVTYEYDSEGRLTLVRDHNGNILKKYEYNFAQ